MRKNGLGGKLWQGRYIIDSVLFFLRYAEIMFFRPSTNFLTSTCEIYCKQIQVFLERYQRRLKKYLVYYGITPLMRQGFGVLKIFNSIQEKSSQTPKAGSSLFGRELALHPRVCQTWLSFWCPAGMRPGRPGSASLQDHI